MARTLTKYEADNGDVHPLLIDSTRAAVAGTEPPGGVTNTIKPKISKNSREFGLRPRGVVLSRTLGTAPDTFKKRTFLPLRSEADATSATYAPGATVTIGTVAWTVSSFRPEDY